MTSRALIALTAGVALFIQCQYVHSEQTVPVTVQVTSVDSRAASVERLRYIATGGFTPSYQPTPKVLWNMRGIGTRRMRLINVEWNTQVRIRKDGTLDIAWSNELEHQLQLCKENRWIPHIIIGQTLPRGLGTLDSDKRLVGDVSWTVYERYVTSFVEHVAKERGFSVSEWEVGNEMDNPRANWLASRSVRENLDPRGYASYLKLYSHISQALQNYRTAHPALKILVGGPATTQNSMNYPPASDRNWIVRFVDDVGRMKLPCDFIGMHFYGTDWSGDELAVRMGWIRDAMARYGRKMEIWITEWGANPFFTDPGSFALNYDAISGAFGLAFMDFLAGQNDTDAIFLAAKEMKGSPGPALFRADGFPAHAYIALKSYAELGGERLVCSTPNAAIGCVATRDGDKFDVLVWYLDWRDKKIATSRVSRLFAPSAVSVDLRIKARPLDRFALTGLWPGNNVTPPGVSALPAASQPILADSEGMARVFSRGLEFSYGDYVHLRFAPVGGVPH